MTSNSAPGADLGALNRASTMRFPGEMKRTYFPYSESMECPSMRTGEYPLNCHPKRLPLTFAQSSPTAAGFFSGKVTKDSVNQKGSRWDTTVSLNLVRLHIIG
jgi:hypothetical protein